MYFLFKFSGADCIWPISAAKLLSHDDRQSTDYSQFNTKFYHPEHHYIHTLLLLRSIFHNFEQLYKFETQSMLLCFRFNDLRLVQFPSFSIRSEKKRKFKSLNKVYSQFYCITPRITQSSVSSMKFNSLRKRYVSCGATMSVEDQRLIKPSEHNIFLTFFFLKLR